MAERLLSSSPLSSLPNSRLPSSAPATQKYYRPARALPFELHANITIYLEEKLYQQAFGLLQSLVVSSAHATPSQPTFSPTSAQLALTSTLTVHPAQTTRTNNQEARTQADSALRLLRIVSKVLGSLNADFHNAFQFSRAAHSGRRHGSSYLSPQAAERLQSSESDRDLDDTKIDNKFAQSESLYARAEDFWHVVGWAFNCSKLHKQRWERWSLWLEWMVDVLVDDWSLNEQQGDARASLIWTYISHVLGGYGGTRKIMRALFANGLKTSVNEFREVFKNELKEPKKEEREGWKKREADVDVEAEVYGDYLERDDDDLSDEDGNGTKPLRKTRSSTGLRRMTSRASRTSLNSAYNEGEEEGEEGSAYFGGNESLRLRLRFLQLLSDVSVKLPNDFETGEALYTLYVEFIRPLPLATFQAVVSPVAAPDMFSVDTQTTLCEFLLTRSLLEGAAPHTDEPHLRQFKVEGHYLPYAATSSSVVDNAKVSLCLESLLRHLLATDKLTARPGLDYAVAEGCQRRCEKASDSAPKATKKKRQEEMAWPYLLESGERLNDIVRRVHARSKVTKQQQQIQE